MTRGANSHHAPHPKLCHCAMINFISLRKILFFSKKIIFLKEGNRFTAVQSVNYCDLTQLSRCKKFSIYELNQKSYYTINEILSKNGLRYTKKNKIDFVEKRILRTISVYP